MVTNVYKVIHRLHTSPLINIVHIINMIYWCTLKELRHVLDSKMVDIKEGKPALIQLAFPTNKNRAKSVSLWPITLNGIRAAFATSDV